MKYTSLTVNLFKHKQVYIQLAGLLGEKFILGKKLISWRFSASAREHSETLPGKALV